MKGKTNRDNKLRILFWIVFDIPKTKWKKRGSPLFSGYMIIKIECRHFERALPSSWQLHAVLHC